MTADRMPALAIRSGSRATSVRPCRRPVKDVYWRDRHTGVRSERVMTSPGYGQYCPVAKAAELIDQRWTLLVIRELVAGSTRFNDLHRGVPRMSRTLLSKRLRQLVADGFVERREHPDGPTYELTEAGQPVPRRHRGPR
jgi:DNA-binding HxlR family transcriptional regulator